VGLKDLSRKTLGRDKLKNVTHRSSSALEKNSRTSNTKGRGGKNMRGEEETPQRAARMGEG